MSTDSLTDRNTSFSCLPSAFRYDVFIDLSNANLIPTEINEYIEAVKGDALLFQAAGFVTLVLPPHCRPVETLCSKVEYTYNQPARALHRAIDRAAGADRHLATILSPLLARNEVLQHLIDDFGLDPMFGTVQPRFAESATDRIWPLPGDDRDRVSPKLTRSGLLMLSPHITTPELLAACMVIRREVVEQIREDHPVFLNSTAELTLLLCRARRRGYRNVVDNRLVISGTTSMAQAYPTGSSADMQQLHTIYPDHTKAVLAIKELSQRRLEPLLACLYADGAKLWRRLLLDCRGMASEHNGTSHCMLGLLDGLHELNLGWRVDVLVSASAAQFHHLRGRYEHFGVLVEVPKEDKVYTAAIMLNQPWALSRVCELHRHAFFLAFNMLDTIAWDILYVANDSLESLWRFVARFSDAIFFNSQFTRERFRTRFASTKEMPECVTYHSFTVQEHVDLAAAQQTPGQHILIVGNNYDHKNLGPTLRVLADAFPFDRIIAVGINSKVPHNVTSMPSGQIAESALHELIASAKVIVFPSLYEGFGLPVVQGLAYGRPVVVRESGLWQEIASHMRMPGQLVTFDSGASLIEAVGRILAGLPLKSLRQGAALHEGEQPLRWRDCSKRMLDVIESLMQNPDRTKWHERDEALQAIRLLQT